MENSEAPVSPVSGVACTDLLLRVITAELQRQRPALNALTGLRSVELVVTFSERSGRPFAVVMRPKTEQKIS